MKKLLKREKALKKEVVRGRRAAIQLQRCKQVADALKGVCEIFDGWKALHDRPASIANFASAQAS